MNRKTLVFTYALFLMFLAFSVTPVHSQVTFNPTVEVTLGGLQPGSVIGAGTMSQIVRTTTFFFNLRDNQSARGAYNNEGDQQREGQ